MQRLAPRPPTRLNRPTLDESEIERIRRERLEPRPTQWDYLHLRGLRRALAETFLQLPLPRGPVLDLFCGTKPYVELVPSGRVFGTDLDRHFGRADVLASLPLPFPDGAFGAVLCTQALHLVDDPIGTVEEMARVLDPAGWAIVTIPHLFIAEGPVERHWSAEDLLEVFSGWFDVRIRRIDGPGAGIAFVVGRPAMRAARRWPAVRALYGPAMALLNAACWALDRVALPLQRRWPHGLLLVARRPRSPAKTHDAGDHGRDPVR